FEGLDVENLWDTCLDSGAGCSAGSSSAALWVEFDLGERHRLTSTRLFGDANDAWVSTSWSMRIKAAEQDAWTPVFIDRDALHSAWNEIDLDVPARYVRVEIQGDAATGAVEARELEINGVVEPCTASLEICDDGLDNDCDDAIDQQDSNCSPETPEACLDVTVCSDNDSCCPAGCAGEDNDCSVTGTGSVTCTDNPDGGKDCSGTINIQGCNNASDASLIALFLSMFGLFPFRRRENAR
ncbi:MAG: discoidin domain-containing protein, partial [Myxococcota bacterium]